MTKRLALPVGTILTVIGGASTRFKIILLKNHLESRIARQMAAAPINRYCKGLRSPIGTIVTNSSSAIPRIRPNERQTTPIIAGGITLFLSNSIDLILSISMATVVPGNGLART
jgi:hypothetical protein